MGGKTFKEISYTEGGLGFWREGDRGVFPGAGMMGGGEQVKSGDLQKHLFGSETLTSGSAREGPQTVCSRAKSSGQSPFLFHNGR